MPSFQNGNFVSLTTDAWSNVKNEPVVSYMAVNPENSLFVEAINTEGLCHDANWIAQDLERVMVSLQCNISGAQTDNTSTNKMSWKILEKKFPSQFSMDASPMGTIYWSKIYAQQPRLYIPQYLAILHHI